FGHLRPNGPHDTGPAHCLVRGGYCRGNAALWPVRIRVNRCPSVVVLHRHGLVRAGRTLFRGGKRSSANASYCPFSAFQPFSISAFAPLNSQLLRQLVLWFPEVPLRAESREAT